MKLVLIFIVINLIQRPLESKKTRGGDTDKRIIGGKLVKDIQSFPFVASLMIQNGTELKFQCGASIIAKSWAVTAAHCLYNFTKYKFHVGCCSTKWAGIRYRPVNKRHIHKLFDIATLDYDIGLVRVAKRFEHKSIITMAHSSYEYLTNTKATALGWGKTENVEQAVKPYLSSVDIKVQDWKSCQSYYKRKEIYITERQFCAGVKGQGICNHDSGGPLVQYHGRKKVLIGVVAGGDDICANTEYSGVFANLAVVEGWIKQRIQSKKRHHNGR